MAIKDSAPPAASQEALQARREQFLLVESEWLSRTISYQLGSAILDALHSFRGLLNLPARLIALHRDARGRKLARAGAGGPRGPQQLAWEIASQWPGLSFEQGMARIARSHAAPADAARACHEAARMLMDFDPVLALRYGKAAYERNPTPQLGKWLAFAHHRHGDISAAEALLARPEVAAQVQRASEVRAWTVVRDDARLLSRLPPVPPRAARSAPRREGPLRVLYVVSAMPPTHTSGYAIRSHALARALGGRSDLDLAVVTRPGYPWDRRDAIGPLQPDRRVHADGVDYERLPCDVVYGDALTDYVGRASEVLESYAAAHDIDVIVAASNHVNALPALVAARRLGCAFVYEVRGLWELSTAARTPDFERTERFRLHRALETLVATEADGVVTLTEGLRQELAAAGVDGGKISLVPNAVDAQRFSGRARDSSLAASLGLPPGRLMLGFAGSLEPYEGLADLLDALHVLVGEGLDVGLLLVGDGRQRAELAQRTLRLGLGDRVVFAGRVPAGEVESYYSLMDVAPFPRLPLKVCELVSPIKPMEAMAMGKAVLVSSVQALRDIVEDGSTGLVFEKGRPQALAAALRRLLADEPLRRELGERARAVAQESFTWARRADAMAARLHAAAGAAAAAQPAQVWAPVPSSSAAVSPRCTRELSRKAQVW